MCKSMLHAGCTVFARGRSRLACAACLPKLPWHSTQAQRAALAGQASSDLRNEPLSQIVYPHGEIALVRAVSGVTCRQMAHPG